ncbi:autotransporter assembly complex protein TamA [Psychromonas sp. PT13]|uniref:autotransporter assembly complex protein TamA n=1 Tax=Psychromonas sp. PT13 TaxID=3439547 RepID=UPI003EB79F93
MLSHYRAYIIKLTFLFPLIGYHLTSFADIDYSIEGVNDEAKANVSVYLAQMNQPDNAENNIYLKQVEEVTLNALKALGYYQSKMTSTVSGEIGKQTVLVDIVPGAQTHVKKIDLNITGEGLLDRRFQDLIANFPIKDGDVFNHGTYESAKEQIKALAQQRGYFDAKYVKSSVEVSSKHNSAVVYLWFETGIRYQFGELVFDQQNRSEKYIRSLQSFAAGDPFDFSKLRNFNVEISNTGYFKSITILPLIDEKEGRRIPLRVVANNQPKDSYNVGIGYSTDVGVNGSLGWSRPWVNSQGHSIEADLSASSSEQEYSATYKIPIGDPNYDYASIKAGYIVDNQNDTDTDQYVVTFGRHRRSANNWLYTLFLEYDYEFGTQGSEEYNLRTISTGINFSKTTSRGGINATHGESRLGSLRVANEFWLSDTNFVKAYGKYKRLATSGNHQFVGYTELGAISADSIDDVPSSMRFFTGGDQSIRGFSYETIAPEDDDGLLEGGLYLTVASLEYRYAITESWKVALFTDAGTATNDFSEDFSSSAGIGAVWASPIGPIRFYLAKPLSDSDDSLGFHFMLGPEL